MPPLETWTTDDFRRHIRTNAADVLCDRLFSAPPWLFNANCALRPKSTYGRFRTIVGSAIGTPSANVYLVGSAATRFSCSPDKTKFAAEFSTVSDLDVVVVAADIFEQIWTELLKASAVGQSQIRLDNAPNVFRRFVYRPTKDYGSTMLREFAKSTIDMIREIQLSTGIKNQIGFRIYRDIEAAKLYHSAGFLTCKGLV